MTYILNIETSTKMCSVSLSKEGELLNVIEESAQKYIHSEKLTLLIIALLKEAGVALAQLGAIAISKGPGSFTGLRIGVSTAKGLCYALNIPLIAIDSLFSLNQGFIAENGPLSTNEISLPMIDARRMEVFTSAFRSDGSQLFKTKAQVVDANFFESLKNYSRVYVFGDGAAKLKNEFNPSNTVFNTQINCSSKYLVDQSFKLYTKKKFENVAYFEPYYLKDFKPF